MVIDLILFDFYVGYEVLFSLYVVLCACVNGLTTSSPPLASCSVSPLLAARVYKCPAPGQRALPIRASLAPFNNFLKAQHLSPVELAGYCLFRNDRLCKRGGVVAALMSGLTLLFLSYSYPTLLGRDVQCKCFWMQLKVTCSDCHVSFHGTCVKMSKADIEFLNNESMMWRGDPCSKKPRSSLRLESKATEGKLTLEDVMKAINELKCDQKTNVTEFNTSYELMNSKLDENTSALKENTVKMIEYLDRIDALTAENKQLKDKVFNLEQKYSRRNCVELQGVPVVGNVLDTVKEVGKALGMEVTDTMVDACHTLAKRSSDSKPPGIIIKFVRRFDAENMMAKRRAKKDFSTRHIGLTSDEPIYVNESLTPTRRRLLGMTRDFKKRTITSLCGCEEVKSFCEKMKRDPFL
ncbi:hypothetical protein J6590_084667 [Homalodisca vitripennis]|nr:hypothetical protein J6590_084667 [Homalodisca vitripennis]